jgi:hypothetical protein
LLTLRLGPLALELNPVVIAEVVSKYALPELTYKFLANGTVTPAPVYVITVGAANAPPALADTRVDEPDDIPNG